MKRALVLLLAIAVAIAAFILLRSGGEPAQPTPPTGNSSPSTPPPTADQPRSAAVDPGRTIAIGNQPLELPPSRTASTAYVLRGRIEADPRAALARARLRVHRGAPNDRALSFSSLMGSALPDQDARIRDFSLKVVGDPVAEVAVDPDGRFAIGGLALRDLRLVLDDDFYGLDQTIVVHAPPGATEVDLGTLPSHCGALVRGRVLGLPAGSPASIDLALDADPMDFIRNGTAYMSQALQGGGNRAAVAADGGFVFRAVSPSPTATLALDAETCVAPLQQLVLGPGEIHEVVVLAHRAASVRVHVVDSAGAAIAEAAVLAMPKGVEGQFAAQRAMRHVKTDGEGFATLTALRDGDWSVIARHAGYLPKDLDQSVSGDQTIELELRLGSGTAVSGIVVDSEDKPIAGARVGRVDDFEVPVIGRVSSMIGVEMWAIQVKDSPFETDADGHFQVTGIPDGKPATLAAWHADYSGALATDVKTGATDVRLVMNRPARLRGRVVDDLTGDPILEFDARTIESMALVMERPTAIAKPDPKLPGGFVMSSVPARKTTLRVESEGYSSLEQSVEPVADKELDLGELRLQREAVVRGRVLDHEAQGLRGASVTEYRRGLQGNAMLQMLTDSVRAVSKSDGSYELRGLRLGALELKATHGDFASGRSKRVTVTAGQTFEGVDIVLEGGGAISGRIRLGPAQIASEWQIFATLEMQAATYASKPKDDGTFRIEHMDAGRYDVQAINGKALQRMQTDSRTDVLAGRSLDIMKFVRAAQEFSVTQRTQVRDGETTELEIDVSDLDDGRGELTLDVAVGDKPLETGMVEARDSSGVVVVGFVQKGTTTFRRLQPGLATFQVRSGLTMSPIGEPQSLELAATAGPLHLRLSLPGGSVSGRVVDDEHGQAIAKAVVRLVAVDSGKEGRGADVGFALTDDDGGFTFRGLTDGSFSLIADDMFRTRAGEVAGRIDGVRVASGEHVERLVLRARRGAGIRIQVVDDIGTPVAHARTLAVAPDGSPLGSMPFALTDDQGVAELAGLPGGATRVVAWVSGLAPGASAVQTLDEHARAEFQVVLSHGPDTELRILDAEGNPLAHAGLSVRFADGPWLPAIVLGRIVDGEGRIDLGPMPSTTVEFAVTHPRASYVARRVLGGGARATIVLRP